MQARPPCYTQHPLMTYWQSHYQTTRNYNKKNSAELRAENSSPTHQWYLIHSKWRIAHKNYKKTRSPWMWSLASRDSNWGECTYHHARLQVSTCSGYDLCHPGQHTDTHRQTAFDQILLAQSAAEPNKELSLSCHSDSAPVPSLRRSRSFKVTDF